MTDIEKKALALLKEVLKECGYTGAIVIDRNCEPQAEALCRAIEQHEAFRQEVSDAVSAVVPLIETWVGNHDCAGQRAADPLTRFIIAKPDPLVEVLIEMNWAYDDYVPGIAADLREALAKRGGKIVWENSGA